ncbi:hypothetical protein GON22_16740 [Paenibacillus sp. MMS18-CY102]|nr:hypothetical protein [Paenibacillus sp. MMS18-CY102]
MPETNFAIALYRPHPGKEQELRQIVKEHEPALRQEGLIADHPLTRVEAADGTIIEMFEWKSAEAMHQAHKSTVVWPIWERMMAVAEMANLGSLQEANQPFPNFRRLEL